MSGAVGHDRALAERYALERELGRGGMGVVYLARDLRHDRPVAIKFLPTELASAVGAARFDQEIQTLAGLTHPHILPLHDSGDADGELYYVMPRVDGESLRDRLDREGPMRVRGALLIARQIADALAYAHAAGVVHRDIKPENILLDRHGHAWVSDFGIARVLDATAEHSRFTSVAMRMGSPPYMSPEQIAGELRVDGRSDLYSFGCVLFEMLAGQPPFADHRPQLVMRRHLVDPAPSLRDRRADVSPALDHLLATLLAKQPEERCPSAEVLVAALDAELGRLMGEDRTPELNAAFRPARARKVAIGALTSAAVLAIAFWGIGLDASGNLFSPVASDGSSLVPSTSIAVLPFEDHSVDGGMGPFARGITMDLIGELRRVTPLDVVSYAGVAAYPPGSVSIDSVAIALDVGTVITGSITRAGGLIRANADIVDVASGRPLATVEISRPWDDLLALRDSLVEDVAFQLRHALGREIELRASRQRATNQEAWELRQLAADLVAEMPAHAASGDGARVSTVAAEADRLLVRASLLDPQWLDPLLDRALLAHAVSWTTVLPSVERQRAAGVAVLLADSAVLRDPTYPRALETRGSITLDRFRGTGATDSMLLFAARRDLEQAVRIDPTVAEAWSDLGSVYQALGDRSSAANALERAYEADAFVDGVGHILYRLFFLYYTEENDGAASSWCSEVRRRSTLVWQFPMCRLLLLAARPASRQDVDEAERLRAELRSHADGLPEQMMNSIDLVLAVVYARAGNADSAFATLHRVRQTHRDPDVVTMKEIEVLAALGRDDEALDLLERVGAADSASRPRFWRRELIDLHSNPRFLRYMQGIERGG